MTVYINNWKQSIKDKLALNVFCDCFGLFFAVLLLKNQVR